MLHVNMIPKNSRFYPPTFSSAYLPVCPSSFLFIQISE